MGDFIKVRTAEFDSTKSDAANKHSLFIVHVKMWHLYFRSSALVQIYWDIQNEK